MKKIITLYIVVILLIIILAVLINLPQWGNLFSYITFTRKLHIIIEGINSILIFSAFVVGNHLYSKLKDERFAIIAGGFLIGTILNCIHIAMMTHFPYDVISLDNLHKNPTLIYLLFGNLILPFSLYFAILHNPSSAKKEDFRTKTYIIYFFIFLILLVLSILSYYFLPSLTDKFQIIIHALEFINYSLYLMLAFILINIRYSSNQTFFPKTTVGLIILGLGGLFYINPALIQIDGILAHIFKCLGFIFVLTGIPRLRNLTKFLRLKDELVAYLCLILISFYVVLITIASAAFRVAFSPFSGYMFVEFLLIFQLLIYIMTNKLTQSITNLTDYLSKYKPGEEPIVIPIDRLDEIGLLTEKINAVSTLSWQSISAMSKMAGRERSIRRIIESMRSISDQNIIKNTIINEISKAFDADRCFIVLYDQVNERFYFDKYFEKLPPEIHVNFKVINDYDLNVKQVDDLLKSNIECCFSNVEEYIEENSLQGTQYEGLLRKYNIKSSCNFPIYYANHLLGYVIIQFTNSYKELKKDDLVFIKTMAAQIGIAINQAEGKGE